MANEVATQGHDGGGYQIAVKDPKELRAIFDEALGGGQLSSFDLTRVRVPAGGGKAWSVPTLEGEVPKQKIQGIIVYQKEVRAYWSTKFGEGGGATPPDCSSQDAVEGVGNPGGLCAKCPMAEFGTALNGGKGQACRTMKLIFMVAEEEILPMVLPLPPMSIQPAKKYFLGLASRGLSYHAVVTEWGLEGAKNGNGIAYSKAIPRMVRKLEPEEHARVKAYVETIRAAIDRVRFSDVEDYHGEEQG